EERVFLHVTKNDYFAIVNDRRTREAPLGRRHAEKAGVHRAEVLFPNKFPVSIKTKNSFRAEDGHDAPTVGGGRGIAMSRFRMPLHARGCLKADDVPEDLPGHAIDRQQAPLIGAFLFYRVDVAVEADLELYVTRADGSGDVNGVTEDDRRGVAEAGEGSFPENIFARSRIPLDGQGL